MPNPKKGKNTVLAFRIYEEVPTTDGALLAYQIEHTLNMERKNDVTETKDAAIVTVGEPTYNLTLKAIASNDPVNNLLYTAFKEGKKLECWIIDKDAPVADQPDKYESQYMIGSLRSWAKPAPLGFVEINTTLDIDGTPADGPATLTAEQANKAQYAFRDLPAPVVTP